MSRVHSQRSFGIKSGNWGGLLALFTVASIIEAVFWNQMNVFTPIYLPKLGISPADVKTWTGAIGAIAGLIGLPFLPFWGALADRYSRQPVIVRSFVAHLLAGLVALLAGNVWVFMLGRALSSFSLGNSGLMMTTIAERTPKARAGFAFSVIGASSPLGIFLGPLVGGPIVDNWGFPALLAIDVVLMLGVVLAMAFGYRDDFAGTESAPLLRMAGDSVLIIWRSMRLRALFPALFLLFAGWMLAFSYISLVVEEIYQGPKSNLGTVTGFVVGVSGVVTLILGPIVGMLADRFGHWRVLLAGAAAAVLLWPLPMLTRDVAAFAAAWAVLSGVSSAVFAISFSVMSSSAAPRVRGRVMSFAYLPVNMGFILGAGLGSVVTQGSVFNVFPVAAVLTVLGFFAVIYAARQKPMEEGETPARVESAPIPLPADQGSGMKAG